MTLVLPRTYAALYTPFDADGNVDRPSLRGLCDRLLAAGVALVPCGTTGETPTLSRGDQDLVISIAVEAAQGGPVLAGTGTNSTATTLATTRRAQELGCDLALVVTPYYNRPPQPCLVEHFRAVADEGRLPVVLYNVPGRTGCALSLESILELSEHPNIVGIKEASGDLGLIEDLVRLGPGEGFEIYSGDDALTAPIMSRGGHGVISVAANVAPRSMVALVAAATQGDGRQLESLQGTLQPLFDALFSTTNPIPIKRAAALLGHARPDMRMPLGAQAMTDEMIGDLQRALDRVQALEAQG